MNLLLSTFAATTNKRMIYGLYNIYNFFLSTSYSSLSLQIVNLCVGCHNVKNEDFISPSHIKSA
ncbi:hypothetical protein LINPERPRIM_LOCUS43548 [Linum perenne]